MAFSDKDLHSNLEYRAITAATGLIVDMKGYRSAEFVFMSNAALDVTMQYSDEVDDVDEPTALVDGEDVDPYAINGTFNEDGTVTSEPVHGTVRIGYLPEMGKARRFITVAATAGGIAVLRPLILPTEGRGRIRPIKDGGI